MDTLELDHNRNEDTVWGVVYGNGVFAAAKRVILSISIFRKDSRTNEIVNVRNSYVIDDPRDLERFRQWAAITLGRTLNVKPKDNIISGSPNPYILTLYSSAKNEKDAEICAFRLNELFEGFSEEKFMALVQQLNAKEEKRAVPIQGTQRDNSR